MRLGEVLRLFVKAIDVCLELFEVHSPNPTTPDLDGGEFARPDERVDLGHAYVEIRSDVLERQEARPDRGGLPVRAITIWVRSHVSQDSTERPRLRISEAVSFGLVHRKVV